METDKHISTADHNEAAVVELDDQLGHFINQEDHETSKLESLKKNKWAVVWCMFAVWTTILVSFENQAAGSVISIPEFRKDFGSYLPSDGSYVIPANWQSAFSGAPVASTAIGALCSGQIADYIGRKNTLIIALILSWGAVTLEFVSTTNPEFFGGKLMNGFAVGTMANICTTYVGEVSPLPLRGLMTCMLSLAYTIGPFTCALILNSTGVYTNRWAYRAVFVSQYGFAAISSLVIAFMPESPWWLVNKGRDEQALKSLHRLGYADEAPARLANIKLTLEEIRQETEGVTYLECFRRSNLRRTIICIAPLSIQAMGGVIFIAGYSTYYAELAGFSTSMAFKLFVALQVCSMTGNICSWFLVDRLGRRALTFWGIAALTVLLLLTGGLATQTKPSFLKGVVGLMVFYGFIYNITIGATAYNLLAEVATSRLRVKTIAIGIALQNLLYMMWSFVLPYLFNPDKANLGAKISFIFGGFSVLSLIYLWFYQVETANRSYEELDEMFMKGIPARKFSSYVTDAETRGRNAKSELKGVN